MPKNKKINCRVEKKLNLLVFAGNLCSLRSISADSKKNYWQNYSGGSLNKNEIGSVSKFMALFRRVDFGLAEASFLIYENDKIEKELDKFLGENQAKHFFQILKLFKSRFNEVWLKRREGLYQIKNFISDNTETIEKLSNKIKILCDINKKEINFKNIPIHLVIGGSKESDILGWYSKFDKKFDIVLECPDNMKLRQKMFAILVLGHEFFHFSINKNVSLKKYINYTSKRNRKMLGIFSGSIPPEKILEELLISTFIPEGYLAGGYFNGIKPPHQLEKNSHGLIDFVSARRYFANQMRGLAGEYATNKKAIDKEYIRTLTGIIKKNTQRN